MKAYKVGAIVFGVLLGAFVISLICSIDAIKFPTAIPGFILMFGCVGGMVFNIVWYKKTKKPKTNNFQTNKKTLHSTSTIQQIPPTSLGTGLSHHQSLDTKSKKQALVTIIIIIIMISTVLFVFKAFAHPSNAKPSNNQSTVLPDTANPTTYSEIELLTIENHPRIYDNYKTAQDFYNTIGDDRIKVLEGSEFARIQRNLHPYSSDKNVLYIVKQAEEKYFGHVHFNIICPDAANLTVDDVTAIMLDYLPENFFEHYDKDSSYIYGDSQTTAYTYSARLNEKGIEYHNTQAPQYSYYFYFRIINFEGGMYWRAETGFAAYGDKDKGWIEKNTQEWDIDLHALSGSLVKQ